MWLSLLKSSLQQVRRQVSLLLFYDAYCLARQPGSGRRSVITAKLCSIVEEQMRRDETTASQVHVYLMSLGYTLDLRTILRCRTSLGWTFRGSAYCQLIRDVNKQKRLEFARAHRNDNFAYVIFTDECSVQLENHRRRCCRKQGEPARNKPRYSHNYIIDAQWKYQFAPLRAKHPVKN